VLAVLALGLGAVPLAGGTAAAADGGADTVIAQAGVSATAAKLRDFGRDGIGDLVTFDSKGRLSIQPGKGDGTIDTAHKALAGGWPTSSLFVPFGDLNGDGCQDLLVRNNATGYLTAYNGTCGKAFTPNTPHRVIGGGFNTYRFITSPGDMDSDGDPDLLALDQRGELFRFFADGKGGLLPPKSVVSGQNYVSLIGAGDLNGDGIGDLLALDRTGVLWRLLGTGPFTYSIRSRIADGILVTALAVPGDLTGDGRPDLVGRDSSGTLWRWNGTSSATFGAKARISTGWNAYTALY
jgi:hypothetical protein